MSEFKNIQLGKYYITTDSLIYLIYDKVYRHPSGFTRTHVMFNYPDLQAITSIYSVKGAYYSTEPIKGDILPLGREIKCYERGSRYSLTDKVKVCIGDTVKTRYVGEMTISSMAMFGATFVLLTKGEHFWLTTADKLQPVKSKLDRMRKTAMGIV